MMEEGRGPRITLIAGEPSGDALGGELMAAIRERAPRVKFSGVGGGAMRKHGLESLFPLEDIAVMGVRDILVNFRRIMTHIRRTAAFIVKNPPDALVVIDSPEFTHRVARRVRRNLPDLPIVGYVAPSVWAWRRGRARTMRRYLNHVMALLPFEPEVFRAAGGPPCSWVGHPAAQPADSPDGNGFRRRHAIADDAVLLAVLPGSRRGELSRLAGLFGDTAAGLAKKTPGLKIAVLQAGSLAKSPGGAVRDAVASWPVSAMVVEENEKHDLFAAADMALAASGTVALELGMAGVPMVIAYRMDPVSAWIARRFVKIPSVVLVNLVLERLAVSEFLQSEATPAALIPALERIAPESGGHAQMRRDLAEFRQRMQTPEHPARQAAAIVLNLI